MVSFIEKNRDGWERRRKEQTEKQNWLTITEEERRSEFNEDKKTRDKQNINPETRKKERLELAMKRKEHWRRWREVREEEEDLEHSRALRDILVMGGGSDITSSQARGEEHCSDLLDPGYNTGSQARGEGPDPGLQDQVHNTSSQARGEEHYSGLLDPGYKSSS